MQSVCQSALTAIDLEAHRQEVLEKKEEGG
jgi:hypothetical protein